MRALPQEKWRGGSPRVRPTRFCQLLQKSSLPSTLSDLPPWKPQIWKKYTFQPHESALYFHIIFDTSSLSLIPLLSVCLISKQFHLSVQLSIYSGIDTPLNMKACTLLLVFFSGFILPNLGPSFSSFFILETTSLRRHLALSEQHFLAGRGLYGCLYFISLQPKYLGSG